jgi:glycosyltransferase involved in cell wall biosynthesis
MVEGMGYAFGDISGQGLIKRSIVRFLLIFLYSLAFRFAHRVVVLNGDDAADLARLCGVSSRKAELIGGIGVRLCDWPFQAPHTDPISFSLVARLIRPKGIIEYLQAARLVKQKYPAVKFYLLGGLDSSPEAIGEEEIQRWIDEGTVEWPGHVDIHSWLSKTSVFVLPSFYREGVPRSTQEAMATGRPVITTDSPGCRETVIDGTNGFLVPPRDVSALAVAMTRFVENPHLVGKMGRASRQLAIERFDVRVVNAKVMRVLGV